MVDTPSDQDQPDGAESEESELDSKLDTLPDARFSVPVQVDDLVLDKTDPKAPVAAQTGPNEAVLEEEEPKTTEDPYSVQRRIPTQVVRAQKALESGRKIRVLEQQLTTTNVYEPDREPPAQGLHELEKQPGRQPSMLVLLLGGLLLTLIGLGIYQKFMLSPDAKPLSVTAAPLKIDPPKSPQKASGSDPQQLKSKAETTPVDSPPPTKLSDESQTKRKNKKSRKKKRARKKRSASRANSKSTPEADTDLTPALLKTRGTELPVPASVAPKKADKPPEPTLMAPPGDTLPPIPSKEALQKPSTSPPAQKKSSSNALGAKYARMRISGPKGAKIQIDMAKVGTLPLPELVLPAGRHSVWAELSGYEIEMLEVQLKAGQLKTLKLKLKPIPKATLPE